MSFEKPVVVIDNGSYNTKAGFSCDNHPVSIFRTVVGRPSYLKGSYGREPYEVYIGDDAVAKIPDVHLSHPVINGRIIHWDNMERIWHHIFYRELKVAPEDRSVILGCTSVTPMKDKIKCCEVFFETLNAPALCVQPQSVLALYGSGFTTGITLDLGYDTTDINPVYEGGNVGYAQIQTNLAGRQISDYIKQSLGKTADAFGYKTDQIMEEIKRFIYVTKDISISRKDFRKYYKLPDGNQIEIGNEAFMAGEIFFQPDTVCGKKTDYISLQEAIVTAALKCDPELRETMYGAVVPCGGLATIPGLYERLGIELENMADRPVNVISSSEPCTVSWLGGATFAGMSDAKKLWVTKKQYEDHGAKIIRNRFL